MDDNSFKNASSSPLEGGQGLFPEMLANLMHNLPGMAYRCRNDEDWTMLYLSEGCHRVSGYYASELLNNSSISFSDLILPEDREGVRKSVDEAVAKRTQFQMEYRITHKDGSIRWVWEQGNAIYDAENNPRWLDGYIANITTRKKVEEELKQVARNLVELNATKDKFFSLIAHDLQNPVYAMISLSEFLSSNHKSFSENEMTGFINQVNISAQGIYTLLENLLDWARSQTGKITVQREHLSLTKLITGLIEHFRPTLQDKLIDIVFQSEADFQIESDSRLLTSILRNLISNAVKYSHPSSKIKITLTKENDNVRISVYDKGVGIPRRNLERIFRIDNDYKTYGTNHENGSGLGLILVKSFAEKLGGEVSASSKLNQGSTFHLLLSLNRSS